MLTIRQMVAIATQGGAAPVHVSALGKMFNVKPLSVRSIANLMENQKTYLEFRVIDKSVLTGTTSYADLQQKVMALVNSGHAQAPKNDLQQLARRVVGAAGGSITYVSEYWGKVGIARNIGPACRCECIPPGCDRGSRVFAVSKCALLLGPHP